jgi:META domain.
MKKIFLLCFISVLIISGCKKESQKQPPLLNTKWELSYVQDPKTKSVIYYPAVETIKIVVSFTDSVNVVSYTGICNTGQGTYSYSEASGTLEVQNISSTKVACKFIEWESYTTQSLSEAYGYEINGNSLTIYSNWEYNLFFTKK